MVLVQNLLRPRQLELVRLGADLSTGSAAFVDAPGVALTLRPRSLYRFEYWLRWRSPLVTTGIGFSVNGPASPDFVVAQFRWMTTATTGALSYLRAYDESVAGLAVGV